jgi:hypothetical protein
MSPSSTFQVVFFPPLHKGLSKTLIVDLVNGLTFRHPINVNIPSDIAKNDHLGSEISLVLQSLRYVFKSFLTTRKLEYEIDIQHHKLPSTNCMFL